jgi:hypothetical protein
MLIRGATHPLREFHGVTPLGISMRNSCELVRWRVSENKKQIKKSGAPWLEVNLTRNVQRAQKTSKWGRSRGMVGIMSRTRDHPVSHRCSNHD